MQSNLITQAISFRAGQRDYVLQINPGNLDASYRKEAFVYKHFASTKIPIPEIIQVGKLGDLDYEISQRLPGRGLKNHFSEEDERIVPELIQILFAIHQCDVSNWSRYGWFDDNGTGIFESWRKHLTYVCEEERQDGFYGKWHGLFETTFLERDFFDEVFDIMVRFIDACPEERWLIHGAYGYENILVQDGKVTAVLDWIDARYGDFVYDIACLDLWPRGVDFARLCHEFYSGQGVELPNYEERILCYKCYLGLDALRFFAKTNHHEAYNSTCELLRGILKSVT